MSRSAKKGPFVSIRLFDKVQKMNKCDKKYLIWTWSRSSMILPKMIGHTIAVYNGHKHIPIFIREEMIGHKLGEFSKTRQFRSHRKKDRKKKRGGGR